MTLEEQLESVDIGEEGDLWKRGAVAYRKIASLDVWKCLNPMSLRGDPNDIPLQEFRIPPNSVK